MSGYVGALIDHRTPFCNQPKPSLFDGGTGGLFRPGRIQWSYQMKPLQEGQG